MTDTTREALATAIEEALGSLDAGMIHGAADTLRAALAAPVPAAVPVEQGRPKALRIPNDRGRHDYWDYGETVSLEVAQRAEYLYVGPSPAEWAAPSQMSGEQGREALSDTALYCAWDEAGSPCSLKLWKKIARWGAALASPPQAPQPSVPPPDGGGQQMTPEEIYLATVAELQALAKNARHVTQADILEIASMPADELRRRAIRHRDWACHWSHCLDGLGVWKTPGAAPDGCWMPREVRSVVEQLLRRPQQGVKR
jgi:hypothetical protein